MVHASGRFVKPFVGILDDRASDALFLDLVSQSFCPCLGSLLGLARVSFRPWGACSSHALCAAIVCRNSNNNNNNTTNNPPTPLQLLYFVGCFVSQLRSLQQQWQQQQQQRNLSPPASALRGRCCALPPTPLSFFVL